MTTVPIRSKHSAMGVLQRLTGVDEHAPLSAMIEVADRCNEVCVHCYQLQGQKGEIGTDDWRRVLDELSEMGVLFLTISGGEATLRHDFLEIVAYARELKFAVKLFTNGLTMDAALADELARLAVQEVQISLYSPRAEVHDWVTRVPGSFDRTVGAVRLLRERGVAVVIKTVLTSFNVEERVAYRELAAALDADYMLDGGLDPREDGDRGPQSFSISREQWLSVHRDETLFRRPEMPPPRDLDRGVCGACSGNVHIEPDGEVRPCTQLDVPLGNALTDGVRHAWANGAASRAIRDLTWRDLPGCRECDLSRHCGRCFANARKEAGHALAPYRSACQMAVRRYELVRGSRPTIVQVPGHEPGLGPFRELPGHRLEPFAHTVTPEDDARTERLGWARGRPADAPPSVAPGGLVQIRRPGAKHARTEVVPPGGLRPRYP